ncbi:hypothetical protein HNQ42_001519 [Rummeliibacillus stabekisii]|nr:hypothetical protein [Rummeliibacillus stabekisii]
MKCLTATAEDVLENTLYGEFSFRAKGTLVLNRYI